MKVLKWVLGELLYDIALVMMIYIMFFAFANGIFWALRNDSWKLYIFISLIIMILSNILGIRDKRWYWFE